jgi:hypothetical protein
LSAPAPSTLGRLGWMLLLYAGGVAALGVVALLVRWLMRVAGLSTP